MSADKHHPRCATVADSALRCTCDREDARDDAFEVELASLEGWHTCPACDGRGQGCEACADTGRIWQ